MGLFDKFKRKSAKKEVVESGQAAGKRANDRAQKDLTLTELKQQTGAGATLAEEQKKSAKKTAAENTKEAYRLLLKPLVTEKGSFSAQESKYFFAVNPSANKYEIKKAVRALYGVSPVKVNIVNLSGKNVRYGRTSGWTSDLKKAIVTLKKGETIEVYEGV